MRRFTPVELAVGVALVGSVLAVAVPAFVRELHASYFVEPVDGLTRIGNGAVSYAEMHGRFPDSAPLTPPTPPRGHKAPDPPGTWDGHAWSALGFRPVADGVPHAYAFSFDGTGNAFIAQAHGDLDGDGIVSTFEIRGYAPAGEAPRVMPGMYIESELE
ncbi:MAG: hypothetical protein FWD73_00145 [Polyangiaceae bacterium]|nr:hypothetical protein [Polyangiaceae bacterium]